MSLLAALLIGCAETEYYPENDSHWNPKDLSDSLYEKGAVIYNETPESQREEWYYDGNGAYHDHYDYYLDYDARSANLRNSDLKLTYANFEYHDSYDESLVCYDAYCDDYYYDSSERQYGSMSFDFQLGSGRNCNIFMERSGDTFNDRSINWQFVAQPEHPERSGDSSSNYYDCYDDLPAEDVVESINDILW